MDTASLHDIHDLPVLADFTSIASIVIVIIFCIGMTFFIHHFGFTGDLPNRSVNFGIQQRDMMKVSNPFVFELDKDSRLLKDPFRFRLSTLCPCRVVVVWGPQIQAFHRLILTPGREIRQRILQNLELNSDLESLHYDVIEFEQEGKHIVTLPCPEAVTSETLGQMPRGKYPVSVFIFVPDTSGEDHRRLSEEEEDADPDCGTGDEENVETDNTIIGLFVIVHLKDEIVTKDSHVVANYVKTAGIPVYSLQALYVSSRDVTHTESRVADETRSRPSGNPSSQDSPSATLRHRAAWSHGTEAQDLNQQQSEPSCNSVSIPDFNCSSELHQLPDKSCRTSQIKSDSGKDIQDTACEVCSAKDSNVSVCSHDKGSSSSNTLGTGTHSTNPTPDCVVCQSLPAKCALLPCRHNCVCLRCLKLLERCPMCRCTFESYFVLRDNKNGESDDEDEEEEEILNEEELIVRQGIAAQVENYLERINQMVGL